MSTNSKSFQVSQAISNGPDRLVQTVYSSGVTVSTAGGVLVAPAKANHYYMVIAFSFGSATSASASVTHSIDNHAAAGSATKSIKAVHLEKGDSFVCPFSPEGWLVTGLNEPVYVHSDTAGCHYNVVVREIHVPSQFPDNSLL